MTTGNRPQPHVTRNQVERIPRFHAVTLVLSLIVITIVIVRSAWLCDDAFITFRCVDNFIHGNGLTWNPGERVQAFTHPLWALTLSATTIVTGEFYYSSIILSILLSVAAVCLALWTARSNRHAQLLITLAVIGSKPVIDFATSGLENPLTFLLLALFVAIFLGSLDVKRQAAALSVVAALAVVNRLDVALLLAPTLAIVYWQSPKRWLLQRFVLWWSPLLVWLAFATFYYGFPLPNTAYAKLGAGIARADLLAQGLAYLRNFLNWDPLSAFVALSALAVAVAVSWRCLSLAVGVALYVAYVVSAGGDFMTGRFFAAPVFLCLSLLSVPALRFNWWNITPLAALAIAALVWPHSPALVGASYGTGGEEKRWDAGIADERAGYYQWTGLLTQWGTENPPNHPWAARGRSLRADTISFYDGAGIGMIGFYAGPDVYVLDNHALSDPLLARLPTANLKQWRIGHFFRERPAGYLQTLKTGVVSIEDSGLRTFYDTLSVITRGELFSLNRARITYEMLCGTYDSLLESFTLRPKRVTAARIGKPKPRGFPYNCRQCIVLNDNGLMIDLDSTIHTGSLEVSVDHNDDYVFTLYNAGLVIGAIVVAEQFIQERGLRVDTVALPDSVLSVGVDQIFVTGRGGDGKYGLGHLRFLGD